MKNGGLPGFFLYMTGFCENMPGKHPEALEKGGYYAGER
jgi:hypothetical protein